MFGKKQQASGARGAVTVIAAGSTIEGTLRVRGLVQIDGTVDGQVLVEGQVSIGPEGKVIGNVQADDLVVGGHVDGSLGARRHLHVLSTGIVHGDASYTTLQVDRGGVMDGRARLSEEKAMAQAAVENDVELVADVEAAE
jgi:cytoskeletal protein CcmA (bactofilin family)